MSDELEKQKIRELIETWIGASRAGDIDTVLTLMDEDVVFLMPGHQFMRGRAAYAAAARANAGKMKFEGHPEIQEIQIAGNFAFCWNHLTVKITPLLVGPTSRLSPVKVDALPEMPAKHLSGPILSVFRKEPDGRWVLYRDANLLAPVV